MPKRTDPPSAEFIKLVKGRFPYSEDIATFLAHCIHRHDWPLEKSKLEGKDFSFDEGSRQALANWEETYSAFIEGELGHYHEQDGDEVGHSHEGGDQEHTHEGMTGYSKESSDEEDEGDEEDFTEMVTIPTKEFSEFKSGLAKALGLAEAASTDEIMKAVSGLKSSQFSETERAALASLRKKERHLYYREQAVGFAHVPRKPDEMAAELVEIEEKLGEDKAKTQLGFWKSFNDSVIAAGATKRITQPAATAVSGPAKVKISQYAETKKLPFDKALAEVATSDPGLFGEYWREQRAN